MKHISIILLFALLPFIGAGAYYDPLTGRVTSAPPDSTTQTYVDSATATAQQAAIDNATDQMTAHKAEADAHELGNITGVITADTTVTVAASGGDYTTIVDAVNYINGLTIIGNNTVTLSIESGTKSVIPDTVMLNTPYSHKVAIVGAGYSSPYAGTHIRNITGSVGAWTVTLDMTANAWQSTISVGDYILVAVSGGGVDKNISGFYPVTDVDTTNNRVSFTSTHKLDIETIVKDGGAFPVSSTVTIKKALTVISCTGLTIGETAVLFSSIPSSISGIATVASGTDGTAISFQGSGTLDFNGNVYIAGSTVDGIAIGPQMFVELRGGCSGGNIGLNINGGTVYGSFASIVGTITGVSAGVSATYFSAIGCRIQGNTTGVVATSGSTAINGYQSFIKYNTTGVDVVIFSKFANMGGTTASNTDDYLQEPDTALADGSYIYSAD